MSSRNLEDDFARSKWHHAYRAARIRHRQNLDLDISSDDVSWKAQLIVSLNHENKPDLNTAEKLFALKLTDELLSEIESERR